MIIKEGLYCFRMSRCGYWEIRQYINVRDKGHGVEYGLAAVPGERMHADREEARKRTYELNGWRYTPSPARR